MKSGKIQENKSGDFRVTLPKSLAKKAGFEKEDKVDMSIQGGSLVLSPSSKTLSKESRINLNSEKFPDTRSLVNMIRACYMQGCEEIRIFSPDGSIIDGKESLRKVTSNLIGGEAILDRAGEFVVEILVDPAESPVPDIIFQISDLISSIQEDSMEALVTGNTNLASEALGRGIEINCHYRLMIRQLAISVENKAVADSIGVKNTTETIHYAVSARDLSRMGYHIVRIAERITDIEEEIDSEITDSLVDISEILSNMREDSVKALIDNDFELANEVFADMSKVKELDQKTTREILRGHLPSKLDTYQALLFLIRNFRRAAGHTVAISDVATNKAALSIKKSKS